MLQIVKTDNTAYTLPRGGLIGGQADAALTLGRAYAATAWQVYGDGEENPTPLQVTATVEGASRYAGAVALTALIAAARSAAALRYTDPQTGDILTRALHALTVPGRVPVGVGGYKVTLTAYPKEAPWRKANGDAVYLT